MIKTRCICVVIFSCLFSASSFAFFERTLQFYTGIHLRHGTQFATLGNAHDADTGTVNAFEQDETPVLSIARSLLIQLAPYFIVNHRSATNEYVLMEELNRLLDERTIVAARLNTNLVMPDAAQVTRPLDEWVIAAEEGDIAARWEVVRMLFLGLREFEHLHPRVRYAGLYILAFNGWNEAAAQIEVVHREGLLGQPRRELQGERLRLLFHVHNDFAGSR